jgi:hypothetical protein
MALSRHFPRVLCISRDPRLLESRHLVLARKYETVTVGSVEEMSSLPASGQFDVIVLCHSLSSEECEVSAELVRVRWPNAKIVALSVEQDGCFDGADEIVRGLDGPRVLLGTIDHLLAT